MRFLDWIVRRRLKRPSWRVEADDEGIYVRSDQETSVSVSWNEVQEIHAFKLDLLTTDTICLEFLGEDMNPLLHIREESPGFGDDAEQLTTFFPEIDAFWFYQVMQPPFATNFTVLYRRPAEIRTRAEAD